MLITVGRWYNWTLFWLKTVLFIFFIENVHQDSKNVFTKVILGNKMSGLAMAPILSILQSIYEVYRIVPALGI